MGRPLRLLAVLALATGIALAVATGAPAIALPPPPPAIESQTDRRPLSPLVEEARRSRAAVELFRSGERNFAPDPDLVGHPIDPPQTRPTPARPVPVAPRPRVGVVASLLLGLVGGVVGGGAVLVGWAATTHRRPRQPASAT